LWRAGRGAFWRRLVPDRSQKRQTRQPAGGLIDVHFVPFLSNADGDDKHDDFLAIDAVDDAVALPPVELRNERNYELRPTRLSKICARPDRRRANLTAP